MTYQMFLNYTMYILYRIWGIVADRREMKHVTVWNKRGGNVFYHM